MVEEVDNKDNTIRTTGQKYGREKQWSGTQGIIDRQRNSQAIIHVWAATHNVDAVKMSGQLDAQTDTLTDRQTYRQADEHTDTKSTDRGQ